MPFIQFLKFFYNAIKLKVINGYSGLVIYPQKISFWLSLECCSMILHTNSNFIIIIGQVSVLKDSKDSFTYNTAHCSTGNWQKPIRDKRGFFCTCEKKRLLVLPETYHLESFRYVAKLGFSRAWDNPIKKSLIWSYKENEDPTNVKLIYLRYFACLIIKFTA